MALTSFMMQELMKRVRPGQRIASFGYPDIIITPDEVSAIVGNVKLKYLEEKVSLRHGVDYRIPDAQDFFSAIGVELDVYDIINERCCEIICDLNEPQYLDKTYDIVIDVGTLEHCFNIGQALMNMAALVGERCYIIHENPFNWANHGFYNLNPTLFNDFYEQNGFEIIDIMAVDHKSKAVHEVPRTKRFLVGGNAELNLITIAQCKEVVQFTYPTQTKYKKLIGEEK